MNLMPKLCTRTIIVFMKFSERILLKEGKYFHNTEEKQRNFLISKQEGERVKLTQKKTKNFRYNKM